MSWTELTTIPQLREAIKKAPEVYMSVRFGVSEDDIKVTKRAAMEFLKDYKDTDTPRHHEMYCDYFGRVDSDGNVYMG